MPTNSGATIGTLAKLAGVHVETVRYYQRIGLVPAPPRSYGSVRRYPPAAVRRVRFIKRAQALGFTLEEVAALVELADGAHCDKTRTLGEKKLALVDAKLAELAAMRAALKHLVDECARGSAGRGCPLIDALAAEG